MRVVLSESETYYDQITSDVLHENKEQREPRYKNVEKWYACLRLPR